MSKFTFEPSGEVIVVETHLEGRYSQNALMVIDTGATYTMISWNTAAALGLEVDPKRTTRTTTASTIEKCPLTFVPKIKALGRSVKNVPCLVKDLPAESGVDGLLGLSFLRHFSLAIDFKKGVLKID